MRPLSDLINHEDPAWPLVKDWISKAKNEVEILPRNPAQADLALYRTQVTTRSPMGAIVYETGGILVDHGWIRILGSGSLKLRRNLPEWNQGKSFQEYGEPISFLLVADDAIGGFFALNAGAFSPETIQQLYYFSPDTLEWELLDVGYSDFIHWCLNGDLVDFYLGLRWQNWEAEVSKMGGDRAIHFLPPLWMKFEDIETSSRRDATIEEMWRVQMDIREQLNLKDY